MRFVTFLEAIGLSQADVRFPTGKSITDYADMEVLTVCLRADTVQTGSIFPVVKGAKIDALDFIDEAIQNGAVFLMADREVNASVPVIVTSNLRLTIAKAADVLNPTPTLKKIAVTGTNGKTSVAYFVQQILNQAGKVAASIGTIGIVSPVLTQEGSMTTPDSVTLHQSMKTLAEKGVEYIALETSSHGLDQERAGAIDFIAAGFTNLTRDHLDYHETMEAYLAAKMKLFTERVSATGVAVINADVPEFEVIAAAARKRGVSVYGYGANGEELKLLSRHPVLDGQDVVISVLGKSYSIHLNLFGDFQVMNVLCAIGLCMAAGVAVDTIMAILPSLRAPAGRMELVTAVNGASVFVDYAHTPDALERVLFSLKPHAMNRLVCLFGCGGNRDMGKRAQMGVIADRLADDVYITDDNPRMEEAADIRRMIKEACPKGIEIDGREEAIYEALRGLDEGDVLVVCGKGHETGQTIGTTVYRFNDKTEVLTLAAAMQKEVLWKSTELAMALNTTVCPYVNATGVSIDTRTLQYGDLFIALQGENLDGHDYVQMAVDKGASACIVNRLVRNVPACKQIIVSDTLLALESLARFARLRSEAIFIGITGSSGKTTSKEMLRTALGVQGRVFATAGNFNNQIGVPLMLARMPLDTEYAILEMGMNHFGEMAFLSELVRPHHTLITMTGAAHREYFKSDDEIAVAKGEIYEYADKNGTAVLNGESPQYPYLRAEAGRCGIRHVVTFGAGWDADFELTDCIVDAGKTVVRVRWHGSDYTYSIGFSGRPFAMNSLGVLAIVDAVGASVEQAMKALETAQPLPGRGAACEIILSNGRTITLIDDAYNANPKSMEASINTLGVYQYGRRIAVLGDMRELGDEAIAYHQGLADGIIKNEISKIYAVGPLMKTLYETLPASFQGAWTETALEMCSILEQELQDLDVVLVKASNSMGLKKIISFLKGEK